MDARAVTDVVRDWLQQRGVSVMPMKSGLLLSGTSAAAPQLAGAAALVLGAKPDLAPAQVIEALTKTATDVVVGHSFPQRFNSPAGPGPDQATGAGLVNATAALQYALDHF